MLCQTGGCGFLNAHKITSAWFRKSGYRGHHLVCLPSETGPSQVTPTLAGTLPDLLHSWKHLSSVCHVWHTLPSIVSLRSLQLACTSFTDGQSHCCHIINISMKTLQAKFWNETNGLSAAEDSQWFFHEPFMTLGHELHSSCFNAPSRCILNSVQLLKGLLPAYKYHKIQWDYYIKYMPSSQIKAALWLSLTLESFSDNNQHNSS